MTQNNSEILKIEEGDSIASFALMPGIALQEYVAARVSLVSGLIYPGCLLSHQSIEIYIKAIARLEPSKPQPWWHDLNSILKKTNKVVPQLSELIENEKLVDFLDNLHKAYKWQRYGEARWGGNGEGIAKLLDEIISKLKFIHEETIQVPISKIFVPDDFKILFLKENKFFDESKITSNFTASLGIPGMPELII